MRNMNIEETVDLIQSSAIKVLSKIHRRSEDLIEAGLRAGHPKLTDQFARLAAVGCAAAAETMAERLDVLEALASVAPVGPFDGE